VCREQNPVEERITGEEANIRLLTAFINGMQGVTGKELRYRIPNAIDEALQIVNTVHNAVKLEQSRKDKVMLCTIQPRLLIYLKALMSFSIYVLIHKVRGLCKLK
jgi:hypothetical protein